MKNKSSKEEFSNWANELLAIGTFGNDNVKIPEKNINVQDHHLEEEEEEIITAEQAKELQKELKLLTNDESEKFFDCLQILEDNNNISDNSSSRKEVHLQGNKGNYGISKKSLSFILKKTFFGIGRPKITPMLRDPIEIKLEKSRMEKVCV